MKKILFAMVTTAIVLQGCEGPVGPPGPAGEDGLLGEVHEIKATFTPANTFAVDFDFEGDPLAKSDKIVGFILEGEDNLGNDNWEPLPQTFFDNGNTFVYTFNFSRTGFTLFLDGNANPGLLSSAKRTDRYFRLMIVPGWLVGKVDLNNMRDIMAKMGVQETDVQMIY